MWESFETLTCEQVIFIDLGEYLQVSYTGHDKATYHAMAAIMETVHVL